MSKSSGTDEWTTDIIILWTVTKRRHSLNAGFLVMLIFSEGPFLHAEELPDSLPPPSYETITYERTITTAGDLKLKKRIDYSEPKQSEGSTKKSSTKHSRTKSTVAPSPATDSHLSPAAPPPPTYNMFACPSNSIQYKLPIPRNPPAMIQMQATGSRFPLESTHILQNASAAPPPPTYNMFACPSNSIQYKLPIPRNPPAMIQIPNSAETVKGPGGKQICSLCNQLRANNNHRMYRKRSYCPVTKSTPIPSLKDQRFESYEEFKIAVDNLYQKETS